MCVKFISNSKLILVIWFYLRDVILREFNKMWRGREKFLGYRIFLFIIVKVVCFVI